MMKRFQKCILLVCFVSMVFGAETLPVRAPKVHDPTKAQPLTLFVTPTGFSLKTVNVKQGLYYLSVVNRTGGKTLQIQFDRVENPSFTSKVAESSISSRKERFEKLQTLTPGTYKLSIANVPKWTCTLIVK